MIGEPLELSNTAVRSDLNLLLQGVEPPSPDPELSDLTATASLRLPPVEIVEAFLFGMEGMIESSRNRKRDPQSLAE